MGIGKRVSGRVSGSTPVVQGLSGRVVCVERGRLVDIVSFPSRQCGSWSVRLPFGSSTRSNTRLRGSKSQGDPCQTSVLTIPLPVGGTGDFTMVSQTSRPTTPALRGPASPGP